MRKDRVLLKNLTERLMDKEEREEKRDREREGETEIEFKFIKPDISLHLSGK